MSRSKYWCFTLNNYTEDELAKIKDSDYTYLILGKEMATTGTPHLQGYVEFNDKIRVTTIKNRWSISRVHLESAKGTALQNRIYCTKEDPNYFESGTPRNRELERMELVEMIKTGKKDEEIFEAYPEQYIRNFSGITKARSLYIEPRNWIMDIEVYIGPTGTGKTQSAWKYEWEQGMKIFDVNLQSHGFPMDGYENESVVLLDEFRSQIEYGFLLKLMDSKPFTVNVKYGNRKFTAKKLIITSNLEPNQWYPKTEDKSALYRRLNEFACIWDFKKYGEDPELRDEPIGDPIFAITVGTKPNAKPRPKTTTEDYNLDSLFPEESEGLKDKIDKMIEEEEEGEENDLDEPMLNTPKPPEGKGPGSQIFDNQSTQSAMEENTDDLPGELFTQEEINDLNDHDIQYD